MPKTKKKNVSTKPKKMNATQKIASLENIVVGQEQQIKILADEIDKLRGTISSIAKRLNASIQATETHDSVNKIIIDENVKELEGKVKFLVDQKVLTLNQESEIVEKTFVVGRELNGDGEVVNPRVQFAVGSLPKDLKDKIIGNKVGSLVQTDESDLRLEITEAYQINEPKPVEKKFEEEDKTEEKKEEEAPKETGNEAKK